MQTPKQNINKLDATVCKNENISQPSGIYSRNMRLGRDLKKKKNQRKYFCFQMEQRD